MAQSFGKLLRTEADWDEWVHWQTCAKGIDRWKGMIWYFQDDPEGLALVREFVILASEEPFLKWRWVCPSILAMRVFRTSFPLDLAGECQHDHAVIRPVIRPPSVRVEYHRQRPDRIPPRVEASPDPDEVWTGDPRGAIEFLRVHFEGGDT